MGRVLGIGSFGEVRECANTQTGLMFAIKKVKKSHVAQHQITLDLMEQELQIL